MIVHDRTRLIDQLEKQPHFSLFIMNRLKCGYFFHRFGMI
ncbi:hypothetical protein AC062_2238 [Pasteurellaceae bacterium NI1060]|nr:hypothetical protein AC062_2238 [Pasteurellaceae bacterium NI1060]